MTQKPKKEVNSGLANVYFIPKKLKTYPLADKVMVTIFWDTEGILLTDYLPHGQTMNGKYYPDILDCLWAVVVVKMCWKIKKDALI